MCTLCLCVYVYVTYHCLICHTGSKTLLLDVVPAARKNTPTTLALLPLFPFPVYPESHAEDSICLSFSHCNLPFIWAVHFRQIAEL